MVSYIFLALFIAVSLLHLYDSWRDNHRRRKYTKPLLLILLTLFYCFAAEKTLYGFGNRGYNALQNERRSGHDPIHAVLY